jgi:hypothetical protein
LHIPEPANGTILVPHTSIASQRESWRFQKARHQFHELAQKGYPLGYYTTIGGLFHCFCPR